MLEVAYMLDSNFHVHEKSMLPNLGGDPFVFLKQWEKLRCFSALAS